jgi:hypothetical protein
MPIPVGEKEATFVFTVLGNLHAVTHAIGIKDTNIITPRTNIALANLMVANWSGAGAPYAAGNMPSEYTLNNVTVTEMTVTGPISAVSGSGVIGSGGQAVVPINSALLVTKHTASGGRRNKGRMYMPPFLPGESQVDVNGNITVGSVGVIQGQIAVAVAADLADLIEYQLYHQSGSPTPTPITSLTVAGQMATQRRRMR